MKTTQQSPKIVLKTTQLKNSKGHMSLQEDDLIRRLRLSLISAKHALDDHQLEAALGGVERLLANNLQPIASHFSPKIIDTAKIDALIDEKFDLIAQIKELQNQTFNLTNALTKKDRQYEKLATERLILDRLLKVVLLTWIPLDIENDDKEITNEPESPIAASNKKIMTIRKELDKILSPIRIEPSIEMKEHLKQQDLHRFFAYANAATLSEIENCFLDKEVFIKIRNLFGPRGKRKGEGGDGGGGTNILVALMVNIPFNFDVTIRPYHTLRHYAGVAWCNVNNPSKINPWAAFAIRSGVIQDNLDRLKELGWD